MPLIRFARCARDCVNRNRFAGPAWSGTAGGFARQASVVRFDRFVVRRESRRSFATSVDSLGLPFQFLDALPDSGARRFMRRIFFWASGRQWFGCAENRVRAGRGRADFAVIHPFSGSARKNWPLERFREVAARLSMPVRWCAGPEEAIENAVRFDNLYELACWLATRPRLHRQRFWNHASGSGGRNAGGRDLRANRSGGMGAEGRTSTPSQREIGRDQRGCSVGCHRERN